jgi:hypothetical protein
MYEYLDHAPSKVVQKLLIALGVGATPATDPTSVNWPIYYSQEPDQPDNCITIYDTSGIQHGRVMPTQEMIEHHGIQVRIRSQSKDAGHLKAQAVVVAMDQLSFMRGVTIDTSHYTVQTIVRKGSILSLGKESPNSNRLLFTVNAVVAIRQES